MPNRDMLDKIAFVMNKVHSEEGAPLRIDWKDLRFKDEPTDDEFAYLSVVARERYGLIVGKLPLNHNPNDHRSEAFVLNEEQLKASGGFSMSREQLESIVAMLDNDPKEVADFLKAKSKGTLKGTPEN